MRLVKRSEPLRAGLEWVAEEAGAGGGGAGEHELGDRAAWRGHGARRAVMQGPRTAPLAENHCTTKLKFVPRRILTRLPQVQCYALCPTARQRNDWWIVCYCPEPIFGDEKLL